jgi:hypothetical protein
MRNQIILDAIPFSSDFESLVKEVRVKKGTRYFDELASLWKEARSIAEPKALYKPGFTDTGEGDQVIVDGTPLKSRVLKINLKNSHRVFPFVATCGTELDNWAKSIEDMLHSFFAETIKQMALTAAIQHLDAHVKNHFSTGNISIMTPGSLENWPITEQQPLFDILGDVEDAIGVQLKSSLMMSPVQSVSGIIFPTEVTFESCQLCPREKCPGRRAPYDPDLYDKKYKKSSSYE